MNNSIDTLRMRIWTIGQVSKSMGVSYLAARQHVIHAESASDEVKAQAAAKVSGTTVTAADIGENDIYAVGSIACGIKPSQFGDGTILKNLFAFITDPANQAAAMKFIQFIMTLIALFPKTASQVISRIVNGVDFGRITTGLTELQTIQQDLSDKQTIAAASQSDLAKLQTAVSATAHDVATAETLFSNEVEYLKKLLDQDSSAVDPALPVLPPAVVAG